ncbi:DinB family protein [Pontibacter sp. G13]|uniref:DinB family protein n=1 Tax=Pontibacter sp. G13 TaxID=3074898 RepID=UPI00288AB875|nr:DinB family protein [Pontibacter sp. G13]WNJ16430.1 DinB family protein [Pontibacter sp. G13]
MENSPSLIQVKSQIITSAGAIWGDVSRFIESVPDGPFVASWDGTWSIGQELEHLNLSSRPVSSALRIPSMTKASLKVFGSPSHPSRSYDQVVARYQEKLNSGGKATGPYVPKVIDASDRTKLLDTWKTIGRKFVARVDKWSEEDLDGYLIPHPLLGKITLREMLFFTIYHAEHHLNSMQQKLEAASK